MSCVNGCTFSKTYLAVDPLDDDDRVVAYDRIELATEQGPSLDASLVALSPSVGRVPRGCNLIILNEHQIWFNR